MNCSEETSLHSEVITGKELAGYVVYRGGHSYDFTKPTIGQLYDYLFAANGVFLHARRPGLNVCFQIGEHDARGLAPIEAWTNCMIPRIPEAYLKKILELSINACVQFAGDKDDVLREALFHLHRDEQQDRWHLNRPAQVATAVSVRPVDDGPGSTYERAIVELHSHHSMSADFSSQDDADEQGFRIYAVIGEIFSEPKIRVRIGCFGYFLEIPASHVFELPSSFSDALEETESFVETC